VLSGEPRTHDQSAPADLGWMLLAFRAELENELTPATVGGRQLMVIRKDDEIQVADAICPHRGAHLGYGGTLEGEGIRCPFHGRFVKLGQPVNNEYRVRKYRTAEFGEALFVLIDERHEKGFQATMTALARTHELSPGFVLPAHVAAEYVIENVFDAEHFQSVHKVSRQPRLKVREGPRGELIVDGSLKTPAPNVWQVDDVGTDGSVATRLCAHVFSPTLVVTELGAAEAPNVVITGATPTAGGTVIRVAVAVPRSCDGTAPRADVVAGLIDDSRTSFGQDLLVWEHLVPHAPQHLDARDEAVMAFRRFCQDFRAPWPGAVHGC
jgi:3-ketosteroid 9alpha-monooxygenase subunit A